MSSTTTKTVRTTQRSKNNNLNTNKTRRNRKRRIRKRENRVMLKAQQPVPKIERCTLEYASALVNPFGTRATMPCIPDMLVLPSNKFQTKVRGVFSTGTLGCGFVTLNPFLMASSVGQVIPNYTSQPVVYTGVTYNQSDIDYQPSGAGLYPTGVAGADSNSPYGLTFWTNNQRQLRLVAAGLKISYIGSSFKNQGRIVIYRSSGNNPVPPGANAATLLLDNATVMLPISRKSEYIYYVPDSHFFLGYNTWSAYDETINTEAPNRRSLCIWIDGGDTTTPQSWLFEAVAYFEAIGPNLTLSPSQSDPNGLGDVLESLPVRNPTVPPKTIEVSVMQRLLALAKRKLYENGPQMLRLGSMLASTYLGNNSGLSYPLIEDID